MFRKLQRFLNAEEFVLCRDEINLENRKAIRMLAAAGLPLGIVNVLVQWSVDNRREAQLNSFWLLGYFLLMMLIERFVIPKDSKHATAFFYLLEAPILLVSVLLGTVWDTNHQATTFLLFLVALPVFILDRPLRSMSFLSAWTVLFVVLVLRVKDPAVIPMDLSHALEFFMTSVLMTNVVMQIRLDSLRHMQRMRYSMTHDRQTGCLNRQALASDARNYVNRPLFLVSVALDNLNLYNDFYGRATGEAVTAYFARTMTECFGEKHTYRYQDDEALCVAEGIDEAECLNRIARSREMLSAFELNGRKYPLSCACGFVSGTPSDPEQFRKMIQLSDIYAHRVQKTGSTEILSGEYDEEALRRGIIESNIMTHAQAYETNRLTGLPGMSYFIARADDILSTVADHSRKPMLGFFSLTRLREFNSRFGYKQGDELIAETAAQLRKHFDSRLLCYIISGQFGILCYEEEAEPAVRGIEQELQSFRPGFPIEIKAGFSPYHGGESTISLLDEARLAMNSIRRNPSATICFYDDKLDEEVRFREYILSHLDEAIQKGYLAVFYQAIVRSATGEVCDEEALSRWNDPHYGFLMPARFIPVLEESGLMYKVNLNVVRQVLKDFTFKRALGLPIVPVSVNLSRRDFEQCDMLAEITAMITASGFPKSLIRIEITESAFTENQELLRREVARFRENGFEVWLDDFGSEYSTLNLLQEIDFDLIKLDMRFMRNFSALGKNYIIVSDVLDMARRMGITTLTEGVETREQYEMLRTLGCEKLQGYLFNRPTGLDELTKQISSGTALPYESAYADLSPGDGPGARVLVSDPSENGGEP